MGLASDTDSEICQYLLNKEMRMWRLSQQMPRQGKKTGERRREETGRMEGRDSVLSTPHGGASPCLRTSYWGEWARRPWGRAGPGCRQRGCPTACWIATLSPHFKSEPFLYLENTSCLSYETVNSWSTNTHLYSLWSWSHQWVTDKSFLNKNR